ncbi:MAG TPA: SPFH domain-containing protein, partial [Verrucomicrobiota bacterium]|nr:SPFH domain-containing protein [Verrucomicrobiota bacterium]
TTDVQEAAGTEPPAGPTLNPAVDGYVLTADGNIIHVRATLFYRIDDPIQYVLGFASASNVVQNALNSALVHTAARFRVDDILTRDVAGFRDALTQRVAELLEQWNVGVSVDHCEVQSRPPRQVGNAFDEVLKAEINRNNVLNEARSTANQTLSQAAAQAQSITNAAELERVQLVSELSSLAANFDRVLPEYRKNPQLFVERSLNETLRRALTNVEKWSVPPAIGGKTTETRIWLNRELPRSAPGAASTP